MIENIEEQINKHRQRLNNLINGKATDAGNEDPQKIVNLINQNTRMKADYCKDFEEYER